MGLGLCRWYVNILLAFSFSFINWAGFCLGGRDLSHIVFGVIVVAFFRTYNYYFTLLTICMKININNLLLRNATVFLCCWQVFNFRAHTGPLQMDLRHVSPPNICTLWPLVLHKVYITLYILFIFLLLLALAMYLSNSFICRLFDVYIDVSRLFLL